MSTKTQLWTDTFLDARRLRADPLADAKAVAQARATGTAQTPGDFSGVWAVGRNVLKHEPICHFR